MRRIGVVAIQGDFEKHAVALSRCGVDPVEVRTPEDLASVEAVILPGGESTTVGMLMQRFGLADALKMAAGNGMPIWGTCMGMILMSRTVVDRPEQYTLGILDIAVQRNAFGAQVHSFEDEVVVEGLDEPVLGVFIRSPIACDLGASVRTISKYVGHVVAVRQERLLGTSFHPELTEDLRMHEMFLRL